MGWWLNWGLWLVCCLWAFFVLVDSVIRNIRRFMVLCVVPWFGLPAIGAPAIDCGVGSSGLIPHQLAPK